MSWWVRFLRRKRMEDQLAKELDFHLDQHAADLMARGRSPEQARREARLALGGADQVKEQCRDARGTRWLEDLLQDSRYALRALRQHPGFAAVAILTLALGIGATTVMFTVINGVLLKPLAFPEPGRLVILHRQTERYGEQWGMSYPNFLDCARASRTLAPIAAWGYGGGVLSGAGQAEYVDGAAVSRDLFSVYGIPLARGRAFLADEDRRGGRPVAIIGYGLWQRRFGGRDSALGAAFDFDGKTYTVVGIAPPGFQLDGQADVFTPLGQNTEPRMQNREAQFLHVVARVRKGLTQGQAQAELDLIARHLAEQYPEANKGVAIAVRPLSQDLVGDIRSTLWLLLGAVGVVLLIACVNVASLLVARAVSRERELAMRVALGAGRGRLVRQCLTESSVLGILGGALGVALASIGLRPFILFWPGSLPRAEEIHLDWRVLLFALAASLGSGLAFGLAPALQAPARHLEQMLRAGARTVVGRARRLHSGFVMSEIALAVVLLAAAGILGRAVLRLASLDPGFDTHNVLTAHVAISPGVLESPVRMRTAWRDILDRSRRFPGVRSAALSDIIPMRVGQNALGYWTTPAPPPPDRMPIALASCVTPDYLKVMGIALRRGRFFDDRDRFGSEPVIVIDEVLAAHAFPHRDAIGQGLTIQAMSPRPIRVVGVVAHVRHWGLADDDQSQVRDQIYYPFAQIPDSLMRLFSSFMSLAVRTSVPPLTIADPLGHDLRGAAGDQTLYEVRSMEQLAAASLDRQRFLMTLFGVFAGLALLLASIGIYGVLAYVTSQRRAEIGVRMALGADRRQVVRMVLRQSLRMILPGAAIGVVAALGAARLLQRLVAGVRAAEPVTIVLVVLVLLAAALAASFLPARRASRIDPLSALRAE